MNVVRKYSLDISREKQKKEILEDARILSVCVQQEKPYLFVAEDVNAYCRNSSRPKRTVEIVVIKQDRAFVVDEYEFLGTIVLDFGNSIYHVFYRNM